MVILRSLKEHHFSRISKLIRGSIFAEIMMFLKSAKHAEYKKMRGMSLCSDLTEL